MRVQIHTSKYTTEELFNDIHRLDKEGFKKQVIADKFNIFLGRVGRVLRCSTWEEYQKKHQPVRAEKRGISLVDNLPKGNGKPSPENNSYALDQAVVLLKTIADGVNYLVSVKKAQQDYFRRRQQERRAYYERPTSNY